MVVLIIVIVCLVLMFAFWLYKFIKNKKLNSVPKIKKIKRKKVKSKIKTEETDIKNVHLAVVDKFMVRKELLFWRYLNSILPRSFIAVPKVSLNTLLVPDGDKKIFNLVSDKALDFVVFQESNMHPVLVIDIFDNSYNDETLDEQDPFLVEILTKLNLKMLHIMVDTDFNANETKAQIFKTLNIVENPINE